MTTPTKFTTLDTAADDVLTFHESDLTTEAERKNVIDALQRLIDTGAAWHLEGQVGREAMNAINRGECSLGPTAFVDAYGNYVPSHSEIMPGAPGSLLFVELERKRRLEQQANESDSG